MGTSKKLDFSEKIQLWISFLIRMSLIGALIFALISHQWLNVFLIFLTFCLSFFPAIIERNYKVSLPLELEFFITVFIFASIFLGEIHSYYDRFWWWDIILHIGSGVILGIVGFLIVYILNNRKRFRLNMSAGFVALFSFTFAVAIGAVWEIFEFSIDSFFGLNMQKNGLHDTMWDLIVDSIGALTISLGGYFYLRGGEIHIIDRIIRKFVERNPKLFRKSK